MFFLSLCIQFIVFRLLKQGVKQYFIVDCATYFVRVPKTFDMHNKGKHHVSMMKGKYVEEDDVDMCFACNVRCQNARKLPCCNGCYERIHNSFFSVLDLIPFVMHYY